MTIQQVPPPGNPRAVDTFPFPSNHEPVRVLVFDDEPDQYWFFAYEVCRAIGIAKPSNTVRYLPAETRRLVDRTADADDRPVGQGIDGPWVSIPHPSPLTSGNQKMLVISEAGMYRLLLRSRRPDADQFLTWVTKDVLPTIRRTGEYSLGSSAVAVPSSYSAALRAHADEIDRREAAEREAHVLKASLKAHDELRVAVTRIMGTGDTLTIAEAAQALCRDPRIDTGQMRLFAEMARAEWIYRRGGTGAWRPYQRIVQQGLLEGAITEFQTPDGENHIKVQIRVTFRGLLTLWKLLGGTGDMPDEVLALPAA